MIIFHSALNMIGSLKIFIGQNCSVAPLGWTPTRSCTSRRDAGLPVSRRTLRAALCVAAAVAAAATVLTIVLRGLRPL